MLNKIINWVLGNLPLVIFALVIISQIMRAAKRAREQQSEEQRQARPDALDEDRRTREVQEQIRRRIAERRGGGAPAAEPPALERPAPSPETTQLPDVFDGPLGRMLQELQKRAQPAAQEPPPLPATALRQSAELERQQQLAEQLRTLEEQKMLAKRRAAHLAEARAEVAQGEPALRAVARGRLIDDLRDPQSLRRAFVLREVLGAPVGLR
ncbi:MAG: hypothetical protein JNL39_09195 [Opitutaceae bacterium]|nr:hypothetical protein [Opitutaceae bacterium]